MCRGGKSRSSASRSSMYARAELVVPRSMPIFMLVTAYVRERGRCYALMRFQYYEAANAVPHRRADEDVRGKVRLRRKPAQRQGAGNTIRYIRQPSMFWIAAGDDGGYRECRGGVSRGKS